MIKNEELIRQYAPAVFATAPADRVSDRYEFLPTTDILEVLQEEGWVTRSASQVKSRTWSNDHAKHMLRLRHESISEDQFGVGDSFPEIVLVNCHNGLGAYQLHGGIFRLVCSNGMVIASSTYGGVKQRHIGFDPQEVVKASQKISNDVAEVSDVIRKWSEIELDQEQTNRFVTEAATARFADGIDESVLSALNAPRRFEDNRKDLWTTFNRTQENLLRGGFRNAETRRMVRGISNIDTDVRINKELWRVTEEFAASMN